MAVIFQGALLFLPEMFTSLFLQVQVKSQVFGHESKSSLKSLKNKSLSLLFVMSLLSSAAIQSVKNTAQLYLKKAFTILLSLLYLLAYSISTD